MHRPYLDLFYNCHLPTMKCSTVGTSSKTDKCLSAMYPAKLLRSFSRLDAYLGPTRSVLLNSKCVGAVHTFSGHISQFLAHDMTIQYRCDTPRDDTPYLRISLFLPICACFALTPVSSLLALCFDQFKGAVRCTDPIWIYSITITCQL